MNVMSVVDKVSLLLTKTVMEPKKMKTKKKLSRKELSRQVVLTITLG